MRATKTDAATLSLGKPALGILVFAEAQYKLGKALIESAQTLSLLSWTMWTLGEHDEALARSRAAIRRAEVSEHPHTRAYTLYYHAVLLALEDDLAAARDSADACCALSKANGFKHWIGLASAVRAISNSGLGAADAAEQLEDTAGALAAYRKSDYQLGVTALYVLTARVQLALGARGETQEIANAGVSFTQAHSERLFEAEVLRLKAASLLSLADGDHEEARELLEQAVEIARAQSARAFETEATKMLETLSEGVGTTNQKGTMRW